MEAKERNLMGTLADPEVEFYAIPKFQRPYVWESESFEQLWEDVYEAFKECVTPVNMEEANNGDYFLGPLVFVKEPENPERPVVIIDGQQRITTLHILLWYIYHRLTNETEQERLKKILRRCNGQARLRVACEDAPIFLAVERNVGEITGPSNMATCARYFKTLIGALPENEIEPLWDFMREKIHFVVIVADNYSSAWELFIGLNGKGVPLNPADLIKAYVCGIAEEGEVAAEIWQQRILPLKTDATFFLLMLTRYKLQRFVSENALFREFSKNFPAEIQTQDLAEFGHVFSYFWLESPDRLRAENVSLNLQTEASLRLIRDLGRRDITTLVFKFSKHFGLPAVFSEQFLKIIEIFQLRMAVARKRSKEKKIIRYFKDISFIDQDQDQAIQSIVAFCRLEAPTDEDFKTEVQKLEYGKTPCTLILREREEGERGNIIIRDFEIEHLVPVTATDFWYQAASTNDPKEYKQLVNNIGNLFPIDKLTNVTIGNDNYVTKKDAYQTYLPRWSITRVTQELNSWERNNIENRAQEIATYASLKWSF